MKKVIVIPARFKSSRLPGKVLLDLDGISVIEMVFNQCKKVKNIDEVYIAVDDSTVYDHCLTFTDNVIRTSDDHESGTDRIAEAIKGIDADYVINVQGDEPLIEPSLIEDLASALETNKHNMVSAMHKIHSIEDFQDPNAVKVVCDNENNALYFSRAPIPFPRDGVSCDADLENLPVPPYKHLGIYGYRINFLKKYSQLPVDPLEYVEKLEQLRVLSSGFKIHMIETETETIGIDTKSDYFKVLQILSDRN